MKNTLYKILVSVVSAVMVFTMNSCTNLDETI
jgi:hypothetical protein